MLVCPSFIFVKKLSLEHQMVTKTYLFCNLCDSSDSSESNESWDSSANSTHKFFFTIFFLQKLFQQKKTCRQQISTQKNLNQKPKNWNCDETQKTQIVMKLKNSSCDDT